MPVAKKTQPGVNPAPRARGKAKKQPEHVEHALKYLEANKAKNEQARVEKTEFAECWKAMAQNDIGSFEIAFEGKVYDAEIAGSTKDEINVGELFAMFERKEITKDQFVRSISATQAAIKKECGENTLMKVSKSVPQEAKLTIKERKG